MLEAARQNVADTQQMVAEFQLSINSLKPSHDDDVVLYGSMLLEAGVWMQSNAENQLAVKGERYRLTKSSSIIRFRSTGYCYGYVVVEPAIREVKDKCRSDTRKTTNRQLLQNMSLVSAAT